MFLFDFSWMGGVRLWNAGREQRRCRTWRDLTWRETKKPKAKAKPQVFCGPWRQVSEWWKKMGKKGSGCALPTINELIHEWWWMALFKGCYDPTNKRSNKREQSKASLTGLRVAGPGERINQQGATSKELAKFQGQHQSTKGCWKRDKRGFNGLRSQSCFAPKRFSATRLSRSMKCLGLKKDEAWRFGKGGWDLNGTGVWSLELRFSISFWHTNYYYYHDCLLKNNTVNRWRKEWIQALGG